MNEKSPSQLMDPDNLRSTFYKTPDGLQTRIGIYKQFLHVAQPWHQWVYQHLAIRSNDAVLDAGCGSGELWRENLSALPPDIHVRLVDISAGMLSECRNVLGEGLPFDYLEWDLNRGIPAATPYSLIVACHMLYHVRERDLLINSIRDGLAKEGRAVFTTVGEEHMARIPALVNVFEGRDIVSESPAAQLPQSEFIRLIREAFDEVIIEEYTGTLEITEPEPLIAYILASPTLCGSRYESIDRRRHLAEFVSESVRDEKSRHGSFRVKVQNWLATAHQPHSLRQ